LLDYLKEAERKYPGALAKEALRSSEGITTLAQPQAFEPQSMFLGVRIPESLRFSETTVQVKGIDEADIVKTDGGNIYYSIKYDYGYYDVEIDPLITTATSSTKIIKAFPLSNLKEKSKIKEGGDLYLIKSKDILVILKQDGVILGYDIGNPEKPEKKWEMKFNDQLLTSRVYKDRIYLITKQNFDYNNPCPIVPVVLDNRKKIEIKLLRYLYPAYYCAS